MKIVSWETFSNLPDQTLCCKVALDGSFGEVMLKESVIVDSDENNAETYTNNTSMELTETLDNDGLFDNDQLYAIYEQYDLSHLQTFIYKAIALPHNVQPIRELYQVDEGMFVVIRSIAGTVVFTSHEDDDSVNNELATLDVRDDAQVIQIGEYNNKPEVTTEIIGAIHNG